jgi:hypothetical protein
MDQKQIDELAEAWLKYQQLPDDERRGHRGEHPLFVGWELMYETVRDNPEDAWKAILKIQRSEPSAMILANLAAGPLENLLVSHGPQFIDRCEELARQDAKFRSVLDGVWGWTSMKKDIWERVCIATGKPTDRAMERDKKKKEKQKKSKGRRRIK